MTKNGPETGFDLHHSDNHLVSTKIPNRLVGSILSFFGFFLQILPIAIARRSVWHGSAADKSQHMMDMLASVPGGKTGSRASDSCSPNEFEPEGHGGDKSPSKKQVPHVSRSHANSESCSPKRSSPGSAPRRTVKVSGIKRLVRRAPDTVPVHPPPPPPPPRVWFLSPFPFVSAEVADVGDQRRAAARHQHGCCGEGLLPGPDGRVFHPRRPPRTSPILPQRAQYS